MTLLAPSVFLRSGTDQVLNLCTLPMILYTAVVGVKILFGQAEIILKIWFNTCSFLLPEPGGAYINSNGHDKKRDDMQCPVWVTPWTPALEYRLWWHLTGSIICYSDNTLVVTAKHDIPMLEWKVNTTLEAINCWIESAGTEPSNHEDRNGDVYMPSLVQYPPFT